MARVYVATFRTGLLHSVIAVTKATSQTTFKYDPVVYGTLTAGNGEIFCFFFSELKVKVKVKVKVKCR